jgi:hypothetical protein
VARTSRLVPLKLLKHAETSSPDFILSLPGYVTKTLSGLSRVTIIISMKKNKIIYRISTGVVSAVMVFSIINFTFIDHYPFREGAFVHLGLPPLF